MGAEFQKNDFSSTLDKDTHKKIDKLLFDEKEETKKELSDLYQKIVEDTNINQRLTAALNKLLYKDYPSNKDKRNYHEIQNEIAKDPISWNFTRQMALKKLGFYDTQGKVKIEGKRGIHSQQGEKSFQEKNGLEKTGLGPITVQKLIDSLSEKGTSPTIQQTPSKTPQITNTKEKNIESLKIKEISLSEALKLGRKHELSEIEKATIYKVTGAKPPILNMELTNTNQEILEKNRTTVNKRYKSKGIKAKTEELPSKDKYINYYKKLGETFPNGIEKKGMIIHGTAGGEVASIQKGYSSADFPFLVCRNGLKLMFFEPQQGMGGIGASFIQGNLFSNETTFGVENVCLPNSNGTVEPNETQIASCNEIKTYYENLRNRKLSVNTHYQATQTMNDLGFNQGHTDGKGWSKECLEKLGIKEKLPQEISYTENELKKRKDLSIFNEKEDVWSNIYNKETLKNAKNLMASNL